jgi:hypothetical protein
VLSRFGVLPEQFLHAFSACNSVVCSMSCLISQYPQWFLFHEVAEYLLNISGGGDIPQRKKASREISAKPLFIVGAGGRGRTGMGLPPLDFESSASTNFTTPA